MYDYNLEVEDGDGYDEQEDTFLFWATVNNTVIPVFAHKIADVFKALTDATEVKEGGKVMTAPSFSFGVTHSVDILISDSGELYASHPLRRGDDLPRSKSWKVVHKNVLVAIPREWISMPMNYYGR
jgi:hypothetical protein